MPPDPIEYRVIRHLQATLQAIRSADGYHFDVAGTAVKLDPDHKVEDLIAPDGPRPYVLIEIKPEAWTYYPAGEVMLRMEPTVHWVSEGNLLDDESRMLTFFRGCADVEMAVSKDITRGGLVADTRLVRRLFDTTAQGAQVWAAIDLSMHVHRAYGAPNG